MLVGLGGTAMSQTAAPAGSGTTVLPEIEIVAPRHAQPPRPPRTRVVTRQRRQTPASPPQTEAQMVAGQNEKFDEALIIYNHFARVTKGYLELVGRSSGAAARLLSRDLDRSHAASRADAPSRAAE